jgi:ubiquinone/menaquinone biosynthesis C-methylase UbiE
VDFVISAGVLHHTKTNINKLIKDHARVIKPKGYFFCFIVSNKGQELELWNFCRKVMKNVDINFAFNFLKNKIHPLRLQGFLDHSYGEYKLTSKKYLLKILKKNFSRVQELQGVKGADVTKNNFSNDKYFKKRFGSGNLRFLCVK